MSGWLDGKRALVVGAGSGIGRAVCDAFTHEGATVAALELDAAKCERLESELGHETLVMQGDATVLSDNVAAVDAVVARHGGLDTLVNCVGIFDFYRSIRELDDNAFDEGFDEMFRTNVASQLCSVKAAVDALTATRGNIVLTVSTSGFYPGRGGVMYVATKFAVRGVVVALAHDLAPAIRVNGVAPGGTLNTDLRGPASMQLADSRLDAPDRAEGMRARTPLELAMSSEDHAGSYVFLASDRARGITGTFVHPDGGMSAR